MHNDRLATMWGGIVTETTQWVVFERKKSCFVFQIFFLFVCRLKGRLVEIVSLFLFLFFFLRLFSPCWSTPSVNYRPSIIDRQLRVKLKTVAENKDETTTRLPFFVSLFERVGIRLRIQRIRLPFRRDQLRPKRESVDDMARNLNRYVLLQVARNTKTNQVPSSPWPR